MDTKLLMANVLFSHFDQNPKIKLVKEKKSTNDSRDVYFIYNRSAENDSGVLVGSFELHSC